MHSVIHWFRDDLRLQDNTSLNAASSAGDSVLPLFIWRSALARPMGAASRAWLHRSLHSLDSDVRAQSGRLLCLAGDPAALLLEVCRALKISKVFFNQAASPAEGQADEALRRALASNGIDVTISPPNLLSMPGSILNGSGQPYQVFGAFQRAWEQKLADMALSPAKPTKVTWARAELARAKPIDELGLQPHPAWDAGFWRYFEPGESGAHRRLQQFAGKGIEQYVTGRDALAHDGTSRLSPHFRFGEATPRQVLSALKNNSPSRAKFVNELAWREFAHHLLHHFPDMPERPLRREFERFPYRKDDELLGAWQRGETGYPVVDAGMRQLWQTGWMHNRARMIVGSFLVKDLLLDWREGFRWFWETLVDADLANNSMGWQWIAGCGADAAPFFRIFNPVLQGEKFDPKGEYVRRWIPELARLPDKFIHKPWEAPANILEYAHVKLGSRYPERIVSHSIAREIALEAYQRMRQTA